MGPAGRDVPRSSSRSASIRAAIERGRCARINASGSTHPFSPDVLTAARDIDFPTRGNPRRAASGRPTPAGRVAERRTPLAAGYGCVSTFDKGIEKNATCFVQRPCDYRRALDMRLAFIARQGRAGWRRGATVRPATHLWQGTQGSQ